MAAALCVAAPAAAEAPLPPVRVEAPRDAATLIEADATSFVTVVPVGGPSTRAVSVAELIEREAGVRVRSAGGLGAFTAVSIRGSEAAEVAVFLDGVPLNRAASSTVDLSTIPAESIERIEIYRGVPPPELAGQSVGGAINLVSRVGPRAPAWRGSVGTGSFGARSASAGYGFGERRLRGDASLTYHGAKGDFTYHDTNGTLNNAADDHATTRQNNAFDQFGADVTLGGQVGRATTFRLGSHATIKSQGMPGKQGNETATAHFDSSRVVLDGELDRRWAGRRAVDLRVAPYLIFERSAFNNRNNEDVGLPGAARIDGETLVGGLDTRVRLAIGAHQLASAVLTLSAERFAPYDLLKPERAPAASSRLRGALVVADDVRLLSDRLALTPALRLEGLVNQLATALGSSGPGAVGNHGQSGFLSPQLGVRYRPRPWLTLKGSIGRYVRVPTTVEVFGDGPLVTGNPSLAPEQATVADLGGALQGEAGLLSGLLEAAVFGRSVSDYIGFGPAGSRAFKSQNLGDRQVIGVEARGRARLGKHLGLAAAYTFLRSTSADASGSGASYALPNVPEHKFDARLDAALGPFAIFYELAFVSDVWLDPDNVAGHVVPGRTLHAIGARLGPVAGVPLTLAAELRNLADQRVVQYPLVGGIYAAHQTAPYPLVDLFDHPLPGRAFYLTLVYQP